MIYPGNRETALDIRLHNARLVQQRIDKDRADRLAAYDAQKQSPVSRQLQPSKVTL